MAEHEARLLLLGLVFLVGLAAESIGRRTPLPRGTLLVLVGVVLGPSVLGLVEPFGTDWFALVSQVALTMVGFLLGGRLTLAAMRERGAGVLAVSSAVVGATVLLVTLAVYAVSQDIVLALLLGGLAIATAPAATADVVYETGRQSRFTKTLLGVVAVDDAWAIAIFSVILAVASSLAGGDALDALARGGRDVGGGLLVGLVLGLPAAYLTGRVDPGAPTLVEALGLVALCLGASLWLDVSFLVAAVTLGAVVANVAQHHDRPFHAIQHIEWPFMIVFFLLAGAALHVSSLLGVGLLGAAYVAARVVGRIAGGHVAARSSGLPNSFRWWIGAALLPQSGLSIGLALIASQRFPELRETLLPVILGATVVFELVGPLLTRLAIARTAE